MFHGSCCRSTMHHSTDDILFPYSRGYGFYILENEDDIGTSIRELNGFVLHDRSLRVDIAKKQYNGMPAPRLKGRSSPFGMS